MAKKMKKLMAMLLALAMIVSLVSIPAFAEEPVDEFENFVFEFVDAEQTFTGETDNEEEIVPLLEYPEEDIYWYDEDAEELVIDTVEELQEFALITQGKHEEFAKDDFDGKTVMLGANINLAGDPWYLRDADGEVIADYRIVDFAGTFDGNGKTISNIKLTNKYDSGKNVALCFFRDVIGSVCDLTLADIEAYSIGNASVYALANIVQNQTVEYGVENVHVEDFEVYIDNDECAADTYSQVAGMVRWTGKYGANKDCSVTNLDVTVTGKAVAGGYSAYIAQNSWFENCDVTNATFKIGSVYSGIGGFGGQTQSSSYIQRVFENCDVKNLDITVEYLDAMVGGFLGNLGGMVNCDGCDVSGEITILEDVENAHVGGFTGDLGWQGDWSSDKIGHTFNDCTADVDITAVNADVGGFVGMSAIIDDTVLDQDEAFAVVFTNCTANGDVSTENGAAGGFVGSGDRGVYYNCVADGEASGAVAGGFWGEVFSMPAAPANGNTGKGDAFDGIVISGCTATADYYGETEGELVGVLDVLDEATGYAIPYTAENNTTYAKTVGYVAAIGEEQYKTLAEAVTAANTMGTATIVMLQDIDFDSTAALTIKGNIAITGEYTISRGDYAGTLFSVAKDATLTLDDGIVLDGSNNWTFDSEGYYADMAAGLTLSTGAKNSYTTSNGTEATAAMISIAGGGAVVMNDATIQNNWGGLFKIPAGATLTTNEGSLIKHIHGRVAHDTLNGAWTMNDGKIDDVYGHNTNGGLAYIRYGGVVTINGGEITNVRTLGLNANGNGILFQVYGDYDAYDTDLIVKGGWMHDNDSFSPGDGWGSQIYLNRGGDFKMTGGVIENTKTDHCSAFVANYPTSIELMGGTMEIDPSLAAWFDTLIYGNVIVGEKMEIVGVDDAFFVALGDQDYALDIDGKISGGTMWLMYNKPVTGDGTITSDVLIKADPDYFEHDGKVTIADANWLESLITVNSVGSDASLTVQPAAVINGVQVRVLGSVASGDYANAAEAAAEQAAAYVEEDGANVTSPVLYYHRLTDAQKGKVVVTYDYNGGLDASGWSGSQITSAEAFVPTAPVPTKEGMVLTGWAYAVNNDPECLTMEIGEAYNGEEIAQSVRLIAQWGEADYVCYIRETGVYYETLTAAVADANASEGDDTIVMIKDIDFDSAKALSITGNITIVSEEGTNHVISRGAYTGTLFTVPAGSSLTLDGGIVFDGNNEWTFNKELFEEDLYALNGKQGWATYFTAEEGGTVAEAPMFVVNGTATAKDVTIQNCYNGDKNNNDGKYSIFRVNSGATLTTDGATITHVAANSASIVVGLNDGTWNIMGDTLITDNYAGRNGGLTRNNSGKIVMSGGTIKDNYGYNTNGTVFMMYSGSAANTSEFIMTGGTICGNASVAGDENGRCAAVYLHENSYMKMTGGTICHNIGGARGGIDSYQSSSVLDINRVDQYFVDGVYPNENGKDAYTASNHPVVIDNVSLGGNPRHDVGHTGNFDTWWVTGGIYTQDVDEFCARGYICIPYEDSERTDDYIVVPGYRVNYYSVEKTVTTDPETGEEVTDYQTTLEKKYFHLLPRDKFWHEMDERANYVELTNDEGGVISTWYQEKELVNIYDFQNTKLEGDVNVYGEWKYTDEAAVVLTVDMSGTMYRNKMGGKRYVDVAKAKALDFVEQYADKVNNAGDVRMLAIASFDTDAKVVLNWVNVNTADGLAAAKKAINGMKVADNGKASSNQVCTNFDAGVILTRNLLKQSNVGEIDNKFAIILSDGAPTVTVNSDSDTVGTIKSSFWGNQLDASGKKYQNARAGGGWTHPAEVASTLKYLATGENNLADLTTSYGENKEGIFFVGVGGDMSFKLFNDAVYGTSNGTRTSDVKKKPAAFNNVDALQGIAQADIMKMTTAGWLQNLADRVGGTYASAANATALQNEFDEMLKQIVNS